MTPSLDMFENWNRYYDPSVGRYLSPEPMLQSPNFVLFRAKLEGRGLETYSYASNNPTSRIDDDGLTTRQFKRDGSYSSAAKALDAVGKQRLYDKCAKEANEAGDECRKKDKACQPPPLPKNPSIADVRAADDAQAAGLAACEKKAQCAFDACAAAVADLDGTKGVFEITWSKCMKD